MLFKDKQVNQAQAIKELVGNYYKANPMSPSYTYHKVGDVHYGNLKVSVSATNKGTAIKLEQGTDYLLLDERCYVQAFSARKELLRAVLG